MFQKLFVGFLVCLSLEWEFQEGMGGLFYSLLCVSRAPDSTWSTAVVQYIWINGLKTRQT